jgi:anti-anti-sigma factor
MAGLERGHPTATVEQVAHESGTTVVAIVGELDMASVQDVEAEIEAIIAAAPDRLTFDLSRVTFMDSSGIAMLIRAAHRVAFVEVRDPSPIVQMIIQATGLSEVLHAGL